MEDATSKAASFASKEATKSSVRSTVQCVSSRVRLIATLNRVQERAMREGGVREDQAATQTRRAFFRQLKKVGLFTVQH